MVRYFSDKVERGIELIWMQFNHEQVLEGRRLLQEAADEGDADAHCFLGRTYLGNDHFEDDRDKAFDLIRKSAELGSSSGIITMLQFGKLSEEVVKNTDSAKLEQAVKDVEDLANGGHAFCQLMMGMFYFWSGYWRAKGIDVEKEYGDEEKALAARVAGAKPWFEKALYSGLSVAFVNLYDIYESFDDDKEKLEKALRFAAGTGDYYWRVRLPNWLYEEDRYEEALNEFEKLVQDGYTPALYDVGFQYERGIGTEVDFQKAFSAYEQGAKGGIKRSQIRLGKMLLWGKMATKDEAQAYFWFCQAAEQGNEVAKMWKGHCLLYGFGVKKDEDAATSLLFDALNFNYPDEGESQAMAEESNFDWEEDMLQMFWDLGIAYEGGLGGMPKRDSSAGYYFNMVAKGGWPEAVEKMTHYKYGGLIKRWKRID